MQFSIKTIFAATTAVAILCFLTVAAPIELAFPLLLFVSLFVLPPVLFSGLVFTRGRRQAFFVGCILGGTPHYLVNLYLAVTGGINMLSSVFSSDTYYDEQTAVYFRMLPIVGYSLALVGGLSAVAAHAVLTRQQPESNSIPASDNDAG